MFEHLIDQQCTLDDFSPAFLQAFYYDEDVFFPDFEVLLWGA